MIYHILTEQELDQFKKDGLYQPESLKTEGFIHCSLKDQLIRVADAFYSDHKKLAVLEIDREKLRAPLQFDPIPDGTEKFPHVYGPINYDEITHILGIENIEGEGFRFTESP